MQALHSLAGDVESAVASGDGGRRVAMLRRVTELFASQAPSLSEGHVSVFDDVISRLASHLEFRARVELSERLADIPNAPSRTVRDLASDSDIAIARPVLERSRRLDDVDLVELARRQGQEHLLAISRRESLSERVTDVLVDRGDARVVRSVAANEGARFSAASFARLVEAARADGYLQHALESRRDLPPEQRRKLLAIARAVAREALRAELGTGANPAIDAALDSAGAAIAGDDRLALPTPDEAAFARARQAGQLDEAQIAAWVREGKLDMALAGIADLAKVPVSMVSDAYHATSYDPLLFIVRSLRFGWGTFKLLLTHKAGRVPPQDVTRSAFDSFQQLSVATAQRVVRFTLTRHQAARAVPA